MPSSTFLNLSEAKKKKIMDASIKEFSIHSFDKVSINRIIKDAEISRGSFYMYFDDIYDLALYLVNSLKRDVIGHTDMLRAIQTRDLETIVLTYHSIIYDYYNQETYRNMFRNIIIYFQGRPEEELETIKGKIPANDEINNLATLISSADFKEKSDEYVTNVAELSMGVFRGVMFKTFMLKLDKEASSKLLRDGLNILKYGYKENIK